ncbi:MAG: hypothetical protein Q4E47_03220 [Candidatus Saccharibacteria bacterium]|nr:hypothetical protein [Candidatus Saccharibacteria bacterium]
MQKKRGVIDINGCHVREEELFVANIFANLGHNVTFIEPRRIKGLHTPDIKMSGLVWEIKSPTSGKTDSIERNLKRACHQSCNIIFDARKIKVPIFKVQHILENKAKNHKNIKHLKLITKQNDVIDIK